MRSLKVPVIGGGYWGQHLWARGYFAVTVGNVNQDDIQKYIEEQELHHQKKEEIINDKENYLPYALIYGQKKDLQV